MRAEDLLWQDECARHGTDAAPAAGISLGDKEEGVLRRHLNVIVPVSFACVGDAVTAASYPTVRSITAAHLRKYCSPEALFSDASFASLDTALRPYLASWGYAPAKFPARYGVSLAADRNSVIPADAVIDGTVQLTDRLCGAKNHTSMKLSDCAARGAFVHMADGEIVCIASVNGVAGGERCVEIGVECAPAYRRRGYARSCVCALTGMLLSRGDVVLYRHYSTNTGSAAVARTSGFRPIGRFFSYTSFAI